MSRSLPRRLYRSRDDRMISGVAGGLAEYFDVDPALVRLLWVLATLFSGGVAFLAYLVLWIIVPRQGYEGRPSDVVRSNMDEIAAEARRVAAGVREGFSSEAEEGAAARTSDAAEPQALEQPGHHRDTARERRQQWAAILLIALGALLLASNLGAFWWFEWRFGWPILLIAIGLLMLWNRVRS